MKMLIILDAISFGFLIFLLRLDLSGSATAAGWDFLWLLPLIICLVFSIIIVSVKREQYEQVK